MHPLRQILEALFLISIIHLFLMGCSEPSIELKSFVEPPPVDDSVLRVVQSAPRGKLAEVKLAKEIVVVFNHPIVPLAKLDRVTKGVFKVRPNLPGKFRWYGSRVCAFIPEPGFNPGTTYRIEIPKTAKALNGKMLKEAFHFEFQTPALKLLNHYPGGSPVYREGHGYEEYESNDRSGTTIPYDQKFRLTFNYPVRISDSTLR